MKSQIPFLVLILFVFLIGSCFATNSKDEFLKLLKTRSQFEKEMKFIKNVLRSTKTLQDIGDMSVECALCGVAINEVQGFIAENMTLTEMEQFLQSDICNYFPGLLGQTCDKIVDSLPFIVSLLESQWSVSRVCIDLNLCDKPFPNTTDPQVIPTYVINLDLPPQERWKTVCSIPQFQQAGQYLYKTIISLLAYGGVNIEAAGEFINSMITPEYALEIQGCAKQLGIPYGWLTWFNLGYEIQDDCTSIVAQTNDGKILHARNMDFGLGVGFSSTLKDLTFIADFQSKGKTVFKGTTFAGFVGILSGMKPGAFSITIDTRFYPDSWTEIFFEVIAAIFEKNATLVAFLSRNVLQYENNFESALINLSNDELIADVYYIVAGVKASEGAVITRNRENASDIWRLNPPSRWFEVETNYDHWQPAPWYDDRIDPANDAMNALGRANLTLDGMFQVLSVKPVFNLETTYSILACPADGTYRSYVRNCQYPCSQ